MANKISVGVVGTSWYSDWMHLSTMKSHASVELSAICGRNRTRAEEMAAKHSIAHVFTDFHEIIANGKLDVLIVATPDDLHYPITMEALDAGLHVICEKPLAYNAAQARKMCEKAQAVGVKHMVVFTYRWMPIYRYARQLLDEGYIGRPYQCNIRYLSDHGCAGKYGWRFDRQRSNGVLGDMGSHMIDLSRWFLGDIAKVSGQLASFVNRTSPDGPQFDPANDSAMITLQYANGAQGVIQVSAVTQVGKQGQVQQVVLYGDQGTLDITFTFIGEELRGLRVGEEQFHTIPVPDEVRGGAAPGDWEGLFFKQSLGPRSFIDAILEDRPVVPSFYDGYKAQVVMDAVNESHEKGNWVILT
jgi:predicted dehydrogenase